LYDKIITYNEAVEFIKKIGFMPFSKNPCGYVSLADITYGENWHTGSENDPWLWKDRIAFNKVASYSRVMGKKLMFISIEWYSYFLAVCRPGMTLEERYNNGIIGNMALKIYQCLKDNRPLNTHELKQFLGINKGNNSKFESGLVELQGTMDITVFGASRRKNRRGEYYGWLVSEYTTVEQWAGDEVLEMASKITREEALSIIVSRVREIVPAITDKEICSFLGLKTLEQV
jgi:hypothetical protein